MSDKTETTLRDGTLVRHRSNGYQGKIEGTTSIRACFTRGGTSVQAATSKETFQYRISVAGESMRQVAPLEDLEVLEAAAVVVLRRRTNSPRRPAKTRIATAAITATRINSIQ